MSKAINYGTHKGIFGRFWPMLRVIVLLFSSRMFLCLLSSLLSLNYDFDPLTWGFLLYFFYSSYSSSILLIQTFTQSFPYLLQVAAHLFQAGANIVKLGIQKTRGPEDDNTEELFLGSYWSSFRKLHQHRRWLCQIELSWQRRRCYPRTQ